MSSLIPHIPTRRAHQRARLLIAIVATLTLIVASFPLVSIAEDGGDAAGTTGEINNAPTATDVPPTATDTPPTPTPTSVPPTATTAPTAAITPTATATKAQPTASVTPTATATGGGQSVKDEATASPTATATATPDVSGELARTLNLASSGPGGYSINSVVEDGTGQFCTQSSPGDDEVEYENENDNFITFTCSSDGNNDYSISAPTYGWRYSWKFQSDTNFSGWRDSQIISTSKHQFNNDPIIVRFGPSSTATSGSGQITVHIKSDSVLSAHTPSADPTVDDLQLACDPASVTAAFGESKTVTCTLKLANGDPVSEPVVLSGITVPEPTGWTRSTPEPGPDANAYTFTLTPESCDAVAAEITVESSFTFDGGNPIPGPEAKVDVALDTTTDLTIGTITDSFSTERTFSFDPIAVTGSISYPITANGCAGWNVQLTASDFVYSGPYGGSDIAGTLTSQSISPESGNITLSNSVLAPMTGGPVKLLSGAAGIAWDGTQSYIHTLNLELELPGSAAVGSYTSTLTITAVSGP